jgi:predicted AAA+ superfamily ATPase
MIRRNIQASIERALADTPVVMINGARQTGKTTLAKEIAVKMKAQYFTLDDATTLGLAVSDPAGFIGKQSGPVVIDEIQKAPTLFPAIKLAVDNQRQSGRFLLTGSANVMTLPRLSESLAGRMEILSVFPFSAGELADAQETFVKHIFNGHIPQTHPNIPELNLVNRLICGGYPEANQRTSEERRGAWFAAYISTILQRDIQDLARVDGLHSLPNLLKLLAARTAGLLNLSDIGRDASLPHTTLTRYMALLETVFLVNRLPAWSANFGQRLVKAPKLHLVDTGLACHLVGTNVTRLSEDRSLQGKMLETYVVSELSKQLSWNDPFTKLYHFRTAAGTEVDIVLEKADGAIAGIEVKASATVGASDFQGLKALRDQLGERFSSGVVLYTGDQLIPFGDKLWLVPLPALWAQDI